MHGACACALCVYGRCHIFNLYIIYARVGMYDYAVYVHAVYVSVRTHICIYQVSLHIFINVLFVRLCVCMFVCMGTCVRVY